MTKVNFTEFLKLLKLLFQDSSYKDEPNPEYDPKKNRTSKPPAASPPTVATIQSGILPISLIKLE